MVLTNELIGTMRQGQTAFETPMRQFNTVYARWTLRRWPSPNAADSQFSISNKGFHLIGLNAGKCDDDKKPALCLKHVNGRFPADLC